MIILRNDVVDNQNVSECSRPVLELPFISTLNSIFDSINGPSLDSNFLDVMGSTGLNSGEALVGWRLRGTLCR